MLISYNWLREIAATRLPPRELAGRLTMVGLAVDTVHEAGDDFVLEFDLTSNRPDCLSHLGIAREVAAIERVTINLPDAKIGNVGGKIAEIASVEIVEPELCPRYAARVVRGVRIAKSPQWLIERLESLGQRAINNVTDITNFVLLEQGQPLHAFDLAKLEGAKIVVRLAHANEKLKTLDGTERELEADMLVIADASRAVALAGVMGGEESEITDGTRDVLIESAYFNHDLIRRTARRLGLNTEASKRFERGADHERVIHAQDRAVQLICKIAGGTATEDLIDLRPREFAARQVSLRSSRVRELTGVDVPVHESFQTLKRLGFHAGTSREINALQTWLENRQQQRSGTITLQESDQNLNGRDNLSEVNEAAQNSQTFIVPSWRVDVEIEEDLIEEVIRHYGYDKIESRLPATAAATGEYNRLERRARRARRALAGSGFDEAINFSFVNREQEEQIASLFDLTGEDSSSQPVELRNPIIVGDDLMRRTLLPGLLQSVRRNFNQGTRDVLLFELGRVFCRSLEASGAQPIERESLGIVATGGIRLAERAGASGDVDFYDVKGWLEAAIEAAGVGARLRFVANDTLAHLQAGQAAHIELMDGTRVGAIGRLKDAVAARHKFKQAVYVAEVDFSRLADAPEEVSRYEPLARFPSIVRDVTVTVDRHVAFDELRQTIDELQIAQVSRAQLVDTFEGASVPEGKRSVTLRLEYRAADRTLRDEEVTTLHEQVVNALTAKLDAA